jgi:hypothetical protein
LSFTNSKRTSHITRKTLAITTTITTIKYTIIIHNPGINISNQKAIILEEKSLKIIGMCKKVITTIIYNPGPNMSKQKATILERKSLRIIGKVN